MVPNVIPDDPVSFGRKCSWLAVQSHDSQQIVKTLNLVDVSVSGWKAGISAAYQKGVFVSPPVKQWILIVSKDFPSTGEHSHNDLCTPFLLKLGQTFRDVQFFATHRIVSYSAWARVLEGQIIRQYSWADGTSYWNVGEETPEERALGKHFVDSEDIDWPETGDEDADWELFDAIADTMPIPDEDDVMNLAGGWSIDPSTLAQQNLPPGLGYLGRFPDIAR